MKLVSGECHRTPLMTGQHGSGNGLVPSGNKPLPEPMLTQIYVTRPQWVNNHASHLIKYTVARYLLHEWQCFPEYLWSAVRYFTWGTWLLHANIGITPNLRDIELMGYVTLVAISGIIMQVPFHDVYFSAIRLMAGCWTSWLVGWTW